ncbi:MAG: putative DNA-binding domain-containing protein [Candidatus Eremiobacteraeota bacterium]|nr:putative DNA-binding domain-containing protein [Candidatus Eremiobacteraeota bacterium]
MAAEQIELRELQTWLQTFIVTPGSSQEAIEAAERAAGMAQGSAEKMVLPSSTLSSLERLEIYRGMYLLRMEEALGIDYPAVRDLLGRDSFFAVVADYVEAHPSRSYTLDHVGRHFSDFLAGCKHPQAALLGDLARLEFAMCEVFNEPETPVLTPLDLAAVAPQDWEWARLEPIAALRLLETRYPANEYYTAYNNDRQPPQDLGPRPNRVVIWRQQFKVWRMPLEAAAMQLLRLLVSGQPLGEALAATAATSPLVEDQLFDWFSSWVGEGMFSRITTVRQ